MGLQQMKLEMQALSNENEKDVLHIIKSFRAEAATEEELKNALTHGERYSATMVAKGLRNPQGNSNMVVAIRRMLNLSNSQFIQT